MTASRPLYLVAAPGRAREEIRGALGARVCVLDRAADLLPLSSRDPGVVVLLPEALPATEVVDILVGCATTGGAWIPVFVLEGEGSVLLTLGPGYRYSANELAAWCATGEGDVLLSLPEVIDRVRAARHDINNPLAAALAETQLLMMDAQDQALKDPLDVIQEQLRRIKDMVASLRGLRPPPGQAISRPPARPEA